MTGASADRMVIALLPHCRRLADWREGLAELLRALAGAQRSTGRTWCLHRALAVVPADDRDQLVDQLETAADRHAEAWGDDQAVAALAIAVDAAVDAVEKRLSTAYRAGAR